MIKTLSWEEYADELKVRLDYKIAECAQLKELLKECKDVILDYNNWIMSASPKDSELMLRIDEVLNAK